MKKILFILSIVILTLIGGFFALNAYIYNEKQASVEEIEKNYEPYRATLTGEYVCLPHVGGVPPTKECAGGIKTESGEYYAVDTNLMSQTPPLFNTGEHFTASGVITPIERLSTDHWRKYPVVGIFSITDSVEIDSPPSEPVIEDSDTETYMCTMDAKICPDGSAVGRTGPKCEFSPCPTPDATSARTTTYMGGTVTALSVSVSPQKIVSDSRCPADVMCVWAGTVEVRTVLSTAVSHGEHVLTLGKPQTFGDYTITLVEVTPNKTQEAIPDSSYRFTFEVVKR